MKQTITFSGFVDAFAYMGRSDQFTYKAKRALFDYLEDLDSDYELDVIALCCDFCESDIDTVRSDYTDCVDMNDSEVLDWLGDQTVIVSEYPLVFAQF